MAWHSCLSTSAIHVEEFLGCPVALDFQFFTVQGVSDELVRAGFANVEAIVRDPYPGVEYPSKRAYLFARKPELTFESPAPD